MTQIRGEFILLIRVMKSTKTSLKMQGESLETPMAAAMPCKRAFSQASIRDTEHIAGKGENFVVNYNLVQTLIPTKRPLNSPQVKARACCFVSRHSESVGQNSSSNPKSPGYKRALKSGTGKKGVQTPDIILFSQPWETVSMAQKILEVSQKRQPRETVSSCKRFFTPSNENSRCKSSSG